MPQITVTRSINASVDLIFGAIADVENLPNVVPDVTQIEFLSDRKSGVGTQFRETRLMNGKPSITELEVTEFVENDQVRMVADSHGTVWDSIFTVKAAVAKSELTIKMNARGKWFLPKLMNILFQGLYKRGLEKHMDAVKAHCEKK